MQATPFDFDVITGPSTPRDNRDDAPQSAHDDEVKKPKEPQPN